MKSNQISLFANGQSSLEKENEGLKKQIAALSRQVAALQEQLDSCSNSPTWNVEDFHRRAAFLGYTITDEQAEKIQSIMETMHNPAKGIACHTLDFCIEHNCQPLHEKQKELDKKEKDFKKLMKALSKGADTKIVESYINNL